MRAFAFVLLVSLAGCGSAPTKDPPPAAPSAIARAAYQAKGAPLRQVAGAGTDPRFPVIAPDTPFGAPPSSAAPSPSAPPANASSAEGGTPL